MITALSRHRRSAWHLRLILVSYVFLSIIYNISQPIWEAPDEGSHVEYIRYVQVHRALTIGQPQQRAKMPEEGADRRVGLLWEARRALAQDLVVSVQFLDERGRLVAQHDGEPVDGRLPTTTWMPGEMVRDDHLVRFPSSASHLKPIVVVYEKDTGHRLSAVVDGQEVGDHFVIAR